MKKTLPLLLCLFIQACSTPPSKPVSVPPKKTTAEAAPNWQQHQQKIAKINHWQAEGRMAITHGQKGNNASFVWQQNGDNYRIKLFGPFGSGAVYITGNSQRVELKEANGKIRTAKTPEELLQKVAGWQVPISGMRYWMRGIPTPYGKNAQHQLNPEGCLSSLHEDGWHIDYQNYVVDNATPLPSKLQLENSKLKVKMVIKSWNM